MGWTHSFEIRPIEKQLSYAFVTLRSGDDGGLLVDKARRRNGLGRKLLKVLCGRWSESLDCFRTGGGGFREFCFEPSPDGVLDSGVCTLEAWWDELVEHSELEEGF